MSELEECVHELSIIKRKIQILDSIRKAIALLEITFAIADPLPDEVSEQLDSLRDHEFILWEELRDLAQ
jgi:hypothetical protein